MNENPFEVLRLDPSATEEEVVWSMLKDAFAGILETGQINSAQVIQLGLAWKGTSSLLGWAGLVVVVEPRLVAPGDTPARHWPLAAQGEREDGEVPPGAGGGLPARTARPKTSLDQHLLGRPSDPARRRD